MKRRLIICSSLITIILSCFSFPIFAEETVQDSSNLHSLSDGVFLDQYFYDNYDLLPYLESDGRQYINTGIASSNTLRVNVVFSDLENDQNQPDQNFYNLFGSNSGNGTRFYFYRVVISGSSRFGFGNGYSENQIDFINYSLYDLVFDTTSVYLNDNLIHEFTNNDFNGSNIYIFALNDTTGIRYSCDAKIYKFSIYDYSLNDGEGGYVRYYYPAKSKSGGVIGLYDAVNKTFFVSGSNTPFSNPTDEYVENFQISSFLTSSLTWIGQIFTAIIDMPIVIIFMSIGLAGVMFRWGRRIVHF